ncbi:chemotaxis protein CheW [Pseudomonas xanthosomatis]|uniref:chemotaxis protein CheW n=1 Tax=Pseudomonas xanthosomatis TaxID=2842356 RepID=UPI001C3C41B1|nr:chemotaxis protein CheW [Pseudomonas xanthosomatis]QXH46969.1 chemotaxis protein CheW [Pseudomonas xanthosomatis]
MTALQASFGNLAEAQCIQHLSFRVRQAGYALPIDLVREIIEYAEVTRVPMMPEYIHGVINLRGNVVPVLDLAARFGLSRTAPGKRTCIVITELALEDTSQRLGLVVDAVDAVHDIDTRQVLPPPPFGAQIRVDFIAGMAQQEQGFLIILNLLQVLSTQDLLDLAQARAAD